MQHLFLGVAHVALQLRQDGHGGNGGHGLKLCFLPVLAFQPGLAGHLGGQVAGNASLLGRVGYHLQDAVAVAVDGQLQCLAASASRGQHHLVGCLQVFLAYQVVRVAILAVGLACNG